MSATPDQDQMFVLNRRTHNVIYRKHLGQWTQETIWKPDQFFNIPEELPKRRFAFPCRYLCGQDLKRPHLTCVATLLGMGCRMRLSWFKKIPPIIELDGTIILQFFPRKNRRFAKFKRRVLYYAIKYFTTVMQNLICN